MSATTLVSGLCRAEDSPCRTCFNFFIDYYSFTHFLKSELWVTWIAKVELSEIQNQLTSLLRPTGAATVATPSSSAWQSLPVRGRSVRLDVQFLRDELHSHPKTLTILIAVYWFLSNLKFVILIPVEQASLTTAHCNLRRNLMTD